MTGPYTMGAPWNAVEESPAKQPLNTNPYRFVKKEEHSVCSKRGRKDAERGPGL